MASRSLSDAHPFLAERFLLLAETYAQRFAPWSLLITCVYRTPEEQAVLYAQGRTTPGPKVTWTLRSKHTMAPARAIDVVPVLDRDGPAGPMKGVVDFNDLGRFRPLIALARTVGLLSGGIWMPPDWPHIEMQTEFPSPVVGGEVV